MFRNMGIGAAAVLAAGLVAAGCSDDGDTIVQGGSFAVGNFNGSSTQANIFSTDGHGINEAGTDIGNPGENGYYSTSSTSGSGYGDVGSWAEMVPVNVIWSSDGTAMAFYATTSYNYYDQQCDRQNVWAMYYDGAAFHQPVALFADDVLPDQGDSNYWGEDDGWDFNGYWLTASTEPAGPSCVTAIVAVPLRPSKYDGGTGAATANGRGRSGDWCIFWSAIDQDAAVLDSADDSDGENFNLYMTYFRKAKASSAADNYGFDVNATQVNSLENDYSAAINYNDENVRSFGVVTDGLRGSADFGIDRNSTGNGGNSHDYAIGDEMSGLAVVFVQEADLAATGSDIKIFYSEIDLGVDPTTNAGLVTSPVEIAFASSANAGEDQGGNDETDTTVWEEFSVYNNQLFFYATDTDTSSDSAMFLSVFDPVAGDFSDAIRVTNDDVTDSWNSSFSSFDHIWGADEGLAATVGFYLQASGTTANDTDVICFQAEDDTTDFDTTNWIELDRDTEEDDSCYGLSAAMSRDGNYILVGYLQDDTTGTGNNDVDALYGVVYQTRRATQLSTLVAVHDFSADAPFDGPTRLSTNDFDVDSWSFAEELEYRYGIQSDIENMGLWYTWFDGSGDETLTAVVVNTVVDTIVSSATFGEPVMTIDADDDVITMDNGGTGEDIMEAQGYDDGAGGIAMIFTVHNDAGGTKTDYDTIHAWTADEGVFDLMDTMNAHFGGLTLVGGVTLPKSSSTTGAWAGSYLHLMWMAPATGNGDISIDVPNALFHRVANKNAPATALIEDVFMPALTSLPAMVSSPNFWAWPQESVYNSTKVGVVFVQTPTDTDQQSGGVTKVMYREWNGSAWDDIVHLEDAARGWNHQHGVLVAMDETDETDTMGNAMIFLRVDQSGPWWTGYERDAKLLVRVHD